jgi:hypothetical protein
LGIFLKITLEAQILGKRVLLLTKHGLGYILGDFFYKLSGHPGGHYGSKSHGADLLQLKTICFNRRVMQGVDFTSSLQL